MLALLSVTAAAESSALVVPTFTTHSTQHSSSEQTAVATAEREQHSMNDRSITNNTNRMPIEDGEVGKLQ